jgi:hypothetical protein
MPLDRLTCRDTLGDLIGSLDEGINPLILLPAVVGDRRRHIIIAARGDCATEIERLIREWWEIRYPEAPVIEIWEPQPPSAAG